MIKKLRRKFTRILMGVVTLILFAVFLSMLLSAAGNARRMSEDMLRQALEMPFSPQRPRPPHGGEQGQARPPQSYGRAPVLAAELDADGNVSFLTNQFYFLAEEEARAVVQMAMASAGSTGSIDGYALRWMKSADGGRIAFADVSMEQELLRNLIVNTLPIGGAALAVFFLISLLLSHWAVRPVRLAWERQRQFVADASHELKTPLTVILSNAEMLTGAGVFQDEKKARRMEHIRAEAVRMKKLTEDLLTLARADDAGRPAIRARVDFGDIVTNTVLIFEPVIYDEQKRLAYAPRDGLFVMGDASRLRQLVQILLDNACKYTPEKGLIEVTLRDAGDKTATLAVSSEGDAIPEEECEHIFRRFYRTDKSRSAHGGFGLGLSIAEGIVREHGGRIWVKSRAGAGNTFYVSLPLG